MAHADSGPVRGARLWSAPLVTYVVLQLTLTGLAQVIGGTVGPLMNLVVIIAATLTLSIGIWRRRPEPRRAWLYVVAAMLTFLVESAVIAVTNGPNFSPTVSTIPPLLLGTVAQLLLTAGLVGLVRGVTRPAPADALDAVMTALAAFLLLWVLVLESAMQLGPTNVVIAIGIPIGALLVLTSALRLVFGGGLRDPAVATLLAGVAGLLVVSGVVLATALDTGTLKIPAWVSLPSALYYVAFGAVGVHPQLVRPRQPPPLTIEGADRETSRVRMLLFVVLALAPPVAWAFERSFTTRTMPILLIPIATSAIFLLLLVFRLALISRVAHRRASELARRSRALATSITEQEELQRQLTYRALHDPLTGLYNRIVLTERIEWALTRRAGSGRHALFLLDLDGFKDINDTLGHPVGDDLLVHVAQRLVEIAPEAATLARLGGDEFAVLVEETDAESATEWAEGLLATLRRAYVIGGRELFVTTSIGVLLTDPRHTPPTPSEALRDADLALYAAKASGKNRHTMFYPALRAARLDHARLSNGLRQALTNEEFTLHYQPVVHVLSGGVVAVEALLRWQADNGRPVPPSAFIPVAEDTGLIEPIGAWVLRRACRDAHSWYHQYGVSVAVNVAGRQLMDPTFAEEVLAVLADADLPGAALIVEITESSLIATTETDALYGHLQRLRDHGVRIAIDDFGTGYSSLSYIARLPIDIVKIDKSFTQSLDGTGPAAQDWAFTRAILQMVSSLDMVAIAEGVETAEQAEALRVMRCPLVQGFHYSPAVASAAIDVRLAAQHSPVG